MTNHIGAHVVAALLLLVGITLAGCGAGSGGGFLGDGDGEQTPNEATLSNLPFPVYRKTKMTEEFLATVPDGDDPKSEWMVKLDDTWSAQQANDFIAAVEKAGFAITESGKQVEILMVVVSAPLIELVTFLKAYPTIEFVEEDEETYLIPPEEIDVGGLESDSSQSSSSNVSLQASVPWGLDRIDDEDLPLDGSYSSGLGSGTGVHVYVLDTGITTTHSDFGGRAIPTYDAFSRSQRVCSATDRSCAADRHGHGTHCAGTVGGNSYGVAKGVALHAVKVLSDSGSGSTSGITGAIDWIVGSGPKPAVISMSLGGPGRSAAYNRAIDSAKRAGVTVVVASGNDNSDACSFSPAYVPNAITVGATDNRDNRASFSNYGRCVDILAPGVNIKSASHRSGSATMSGTSMACPHVAGVAALLQAEDRSRSPQQILDKMLAIASTGKLRGLRGEPNKLLFAGGGGGNGPAPGPSPGPSPTPPSGDKIVVKSFDTEGKHDKLQVNGAEYSGTDGPDGVTPVGEVVWSSDYSVERKGWRLCMSSGSWEVLEGPCQKEWFTGCVTSPNYPNNYGSNQNCRLTAGSNSQPQPSPTPSPKPSPPVPTPSPGSCPWKSHSGQNDRLVCGDGSICDVKGPSGWSCCGGKGGRMKCPANAPTMCQSSTCGAGKREHCCAFAGSTCDGEFQGERPCSGAGAPGPSPPGNCPWQQHSGEDDVLECGDGTRCNALAEGWNCCGRRQGRQKCPNNFPEMCNNQECSGDYCCSTAGGCDQLGHGRRPCSR